MNEIEIKNMRKRLVWRANHRGTKEVDILLGTFAVAHVEQMDEAMLTSFQTFMEIADPQMHLIMTHEVDLPVGLHPALASLLSDFSYEPIPKGA